MGNLMQIFSEGMSTICTFLFCGFHGDNLEVGQKEQLGYFVMALFCLTLLVNIAALLIIALVGLAKSCSAWC